MTKADEKLCLQWNDFKENISSAFGDLRQDKEFTDVTLACEDGQQVEAHKVVLVASSPFFLNILKRNKHPHPLIYMRGVRSDNLMAMFDFIYHGETNIRQENLQSFLIFAEELQLKGLKGNPIKKEEEAFGDSATDPLLSKSPKSKAVSRKKSIKKIVSVENLLKTAPSEKSLTLNDDPTTNATGVESLDQQVKSMMKSLDEEVKSMMTSSTNANVKYQRICKVCGKEGSMAHIMGHIEANHIAEISIPCDICGTICPTRPALRMHKSKYHKKQSKEEKAE